MFQQASPKPNRPPQIKARATLKQQTKITEDKIAELDKRLEDLPNVREELVEKYRKEKEMQLKVDANYDYLGEREVENSMLFDAVVEQKFEKEINEIDIENEQSQFRLTEHPTF